MEIAIRGRVLGIVRAPDPHGGEEEGEYRAITDIDAGWLLDQLEAGRSIRTGRYGSTEAVIEGVRE